MAQLCFRCPPTVNRGCMPNHPGSCPLPAIIRHPLHGDASRQRPGLPQRHLDIKAASLQAAHPAPARDMGKESCLPIESDSVALAQQRGTIVYQSYSRAHACARACTHRGELCRCYGGLSLCFSTAPTGATWPRYHKRAKPMPSRKRSCRLSGEICCSESCRESPAVLRQHVLLLR